MSRLNSPTINRAIARVAAKVYYDGLELHRPGLNPNQIAIADLVSQVLENQVVRVLDQLGFLGVLDYSRFEGNKLETLLTIGNVTITQDND